MKKLSVALEDIKNNLDLCRETPNTSNMQVHGLMPEGGKMSTQSTKEHVSQTHSKSRSEVMQSKNKEMTLGKSKEVKKLMTKVFYGCCAVYPTYGKDSEQLTDALQMFNMCLYDYTGEQIKNAFVSWMKTNKSFPTPADIINLIERKGKPAFDKTIYLSLVKKRDNQPP